MTTSASSDPALDAPAWTIRLEQPIDIDQIHELHRAAFPTEAEAELVDAIRSSAGFMQGLSLVAVTDDGSVLGHVLISRIQLAPDDGNEERIDVLALAPIAVLPPQQGRGIGAALMREILALADERDEPFVAVLGSPAYYGRFGFEPASRHQVRSPYDDAGDAFQLRARAGAAIVPGELIYPGPFHGA